MQESDAVIILPRNSWLSVVLAWLIPFLVLAGGLFVMWTLQPTGEVAHGDAVGGGASLFKWGIFIVGVVVVGTLAYFVITDDKRRTAVIANWWDHIDDDSSPGKKLVLFIIALLFGYAEFSLVGSVWLMLLIILGAAIYRPPKGWFTRTCVVVDMVVLILAMIFTGAAEMRHTSFEIADLKFLQQSQKMTEYKENLRKCVKREPGCVVESPQMPEVPPSSARRPNTITATAGQFTYTAIPDNSDFTYFCPSGTIMGFTYSGMPESEGKEADCDIRKDNVLLGDRKRGRIISFKAKNGDTHPLVTMTRRW